MRILAIESSGRLGSVALCRGGDTDFEIVCDRPLPSDQRSAQSLAPAILTALAACQWPATSVDLVSVTVGPGSYTGLRVGVTSAKVFAYGASADVVGVNTLHVLAQQAPAHIDRLWTIMNAQRQQLFAACWQPAHTPPSGDPVLLVDIDEWLTRLQPHDWVTGPYAAHLRPQLPRDVAIVADELLQPSAAAVGRLGWQQYCQGHRDDHWQLVPRYYRRSAAEEKLMGP